MSSLIDTDRYLNKVLNDYHNCMSIGECENCTANERIEGTRNTFCEFLREHRKFVENSMILAMDKCL